MKKEDCILFSGGAYGTEAEFGINAEHAGIEEVNFTFEGRPLGRQRGVRMLNHDELKKGDVSLEYLSGILKRKFIDSPVFRKILQSIWYQINNGQEIYVLGEILENKTVKGGTGWGAEFAKLCNKPLFVFDQKQDSWFFWNQRDWESRGSGNEPVITHPYFTGTGTRFLEANGKKAIAGLFKRSFA
jgi:hypothetical protein